MTKCPLCRGKKTDDYHSDSRRKYRQCRDCRLVYVPSVHQLSEEEEKQHYDLHQNNPADPGYRKFLNRLFKPLRERLPEMAEGLDFGSGPGPTLSLMFEERGYPMAIYDVFYAPDKSVLRRKYQFVTATEVVEHLSCPRTELDRLWSLITPGGWLGIMTKLVIDQRAFADWHYKNDLTHISFFSRDTFGWLGQQWGSAPVFVDKDVILFNKRRSR